MTLKRDRVEDESVEKFEMANCLDIIKRNGLLIRYKVFKCKKQFDSSKKHICSICGEEFAIGQALGGHMRKHRDKLNQHEQKKTKTKTLEENSKSSERILFMDLNLTPNENALMQG
ncbi:zinc finger protein ZAT11-like [Solanum tuberosum]|uniref:zinc finger protein ZAT11-like n=1 Tax=Solanum tuberosum TaxID=4113 RepID=UPI00073A4BCD|nr:PREDICTED: zinc finger protein ZAT11-like [Solanum tuberosum]